MPSVDVIICPFKDHKGGKENSASFKVYNDTNTFHCFGCHKSGNPINFVSLYEKISIKDAVEKLLSLANSDEFMIDIESNTEDFNKKIQLLIDFSEEILKFKKNYSDEKSLLYIDNLCKVYDNLNENLSSVALNEVNILMFKKIKKYINDINSGNI